MSPSSDRGLVVVHTGNGKGKTTAALGIVFRAWGADLRIGVFQFLKQTQARFGEHRAAERLGIPIQALGDGFTWRSRDLDHSGALAARQWATCRAALGACEHDLIVLDELTHAVNKGWVPVGEVIEALRTRPPGLHVVITGRNAPDELVEFADLVTEMHLVKHPYREQGIRAQRGIEF